ncbi:LuxR C-terminal-related transcriptional regulator [Frankia nepalensis]|uniref:LuxR C-terminal-related transcriptional regulator n=1 Tax=Frankia nepalensis TaxID=1836974 RepID=UPI001EE3D9BB|nr:LuxR C-terminal-related transcriptional regulator [Frankia nepalensis]
MDLLGLDDVAAAVYRLWLRDEDLNLETAAAALRQPTAVVARARDRLVAVSLLVPAPDRSGRFVPAHPEAPLEQLIQAQHQLLIRRHEHLLRAQEQVTAFVSEFLATRPDPPGGAGLDRVATAAAIRAELVAMIGAAQREVVSVRTRATLATLAADLLPLELDALRRGVRVRAVVARPRAGLAWASPGVEHLAEVVSAGAQIRLSNDPAVDITVVDGRAGVVRLAHGTGVTGGPGGGPGDGGALVIRGADLAELATLLFDHLWESADRFGVEVAAVEGTLAGEVALAAARAEASGPLRFAAPGTADPRYATAEDDGLEDDGPTGTEGLAGDDDAPPSPSELLLLRLLADGAKDEAAARSLGVSVRTVRRMVADLMRRLDARSRFQAGILAKHRGWL